MKKVLSIVSLIGFLILFLISCGNKNNNDNPNVENNYYNIVFKDYDETILQSSSVKGGTIPSYEGANPTRENDEDYSYTFSGWSPVISR